MLILHLLMLIRVVQVRLRIPELVGLSAIWFLSGLKSITYGVALNQLSLIVSIKGMYPALGKTDRQTLLVVLLAVHTLEVV